VVAFLKPRLPEPCDTPQAAAPLTDSPSASYNPVCVWGFAAAALDHPWFTEAPWPENVPEETLAMLRQQYSAGVQASTEAAKAKRMAAAQQQNAAAAFNPQVQAQLAAAQRVAAMISQQQQGMGLMQGMGMLGPR